MQSKTTTEDRVIPIALDLGRTFWVMARLDAQGQPEVASLGDRGLIAAVISSYQDEVLIGQHYSEPDGIEPLMDIYKSLQGDPRSVGGDSRFVRGYGERMEVCMGGQWYTPAELFGRLVGHVVGMVKEHCSPNEPLPLVLAVPPDVSATAQSQLRDLLEQHEARLVGWCSALEATALSVRELRERPHHLSLVAHVERGAFSIGVVEMEGGFPTLLQSRTFEWPSQSPFPIERVPTAIDELLLLLEEHHALRQDDLQSVLVSGEEAWVPHLESLVLQKVSCDGIGIERPHLATAMGAAALAGMLRDGLFLRPSFPQGEMSQWTLQGVGTPDAKLRVVRGGTGQAQIGMDGRVELPIRLLSAQHERLIVQVIAPGQAPRRVEVSLPASAQEPLRQSNEHAAASGGSMASMPQAGVESKEVEEEAHGRMTSRHGGLRSVLSSSVWLEVNEPLERIEMARAFTSLPVRVVQTIRFQGAQQTLSILEGEADALSAPLLYGAISLADLAAYAVEGDALEAELISNQDGLIELCVRLVREPNREMAAAWHRKQGRPYQGPVEADRGGSSRTTGAQRALRSSSSERIPSVVGSGQRAASREDLASVANDREAGRRQTPPLKERLTSEDSASASMRAGSSKKNKTSEPSESTQPDMEVPEELRNYDDKKSPKVPQHESRASSSGLTAMSPPPVSTSSSNLPAATQRPYLSSPSSGSLSAAQGPRGHASSPSLPSISLGPASGFESVFGEDDLSNPFHAEGDGRTMVLSRKSLLGEGDGATMVFNKQAIGSALAEEKSKSHIAKTQTTPAFQLPKPGLHEARAQQELDLPLEEEEQRRLTLSVPGQRMNQSTQFEQRAVSVSESERLGFSTSASQPFEEVSDMDILDEVNDALSGLREMSSAQGRLHEEGEMTLVSSKANLQQMVRERNARLQTDKTEQHRAVDPTEQHLAVARTEQHRAVPAEEHTRSMMGSDIRGGDTAGGLEPTMDERLSPSYAKQPKSESSILGRLEQAYRLAAEARALIEEAAEVAFVAEQADLQHALAQAALSGEIDTGDRREVRKVIELAGQLCEGEQSRLPSTTRKIIVRMVEEVEAQLQKNSPLATPLALRLANRIFEAIRRDLRPW
ncbi:hypothetical protein L6R29_20820 [Myxococcota bacterium]|nr:hypothetical protein [Myxococcota bacterium]